MVAALLVSLLLAAAAALASEPSDEELILRYQAGDVPAFGTLLTRHQGSVLRFVFRSTHSAARAEELTQEVFLRVVRMAPTYQQSAKFRTWLFTIARNLCIDESRRAERGRVDSLDAPLTSDGDLTRGDLLPDREAVSADQATVRAEFMRRLQAAIAALPEEQREVFELRTSADLRFPEIARMLGKNEDTVKARFRYACQKLRTLLGDYDGFSFEAIGGSGSGGGRG